MERSGGNFASLLVGLVVLARSATAGLGAESPGGFLSPDKVTSLTVPFVLNTGQISDATVKYYAKALGGTVSVTEDGRLVYALPYRGDAQTGGGIVRLEEILVDAQHPDIKAHEPLPAGVNVLKGSDPAAWRCKVPAFRDLRFGDVYPGISLTLRAYGDNVEKRFHVRPGFSYESIRVRISGAKSIGVNAQGQLEARTDVGCATFTQPVAYQETPGGREDVEVAYALDGPDYGFSVAAYDATRELIIDPLMASTFLGSVNDDEAFTMSIGPDGSVYVAGRTDGADFTTTDGAYATGYADGGDVFVARFDPSLSTLLACTYLGGSNEDVARGIAVDSAGHVFLTGSTDSFDFPVTDGAYRTDHGNWWGSDAFVAKLDANLTNLLASTFVGGPAEDSGTALALLTNGNVVVAGETRSSLFPVTTGAYDETFNGYGVWTHYGFSARIKVVTGRLNLVTRNHDHTLNVVFDDSGFVEVARNAFDASNWTPLAGTSGVGFTAGDWHDVTIQVAGATTDVSLDGVPILSVVDTHLPAFTGGGIAIQTMYDSYQDLTSDAYVDDLIVTNEQGVIWADNFDNGDLDHWNLDTWGDPPDPFWGWDIADLGGNNALRGQGNAWGSPSDAQNFDSDGVVFVMNSTLTTLLASTYLGGAYADRPQAVMVDRVGNVLVGGETESPDLPVSDDAYDRTFDGDWVNYSLSFRVRIDEGGLHANVRFSSAGRYLVGLSEDRVSISKESPWGLFRHWGDQPASLATGQWYTVTIASTRTGIAVRVDGIPVMSVADDDPLVLGHVAFESWGNDGDGSTSVVWLDDIVVSNAWGERFADDFEDSRISDWQIGEPEQDSPIPADWVLQTQGTNVVLRGRGHIWADPPWGYGEGADGFVAKLNPDLTELIASSFVGDYGWDQVTALALSTNGTIYVGGETESQDFATTPGAFDTRFDGGSDGFIGAWNEDLSTLTASTFLGGNSGEAVRALAVDHRGEVYAAGSTYSWDFPTSVEAYDRTQNGNEDVFISKFDGGLGRLEASTLLGGWDEDRTCALGLDDSGNVYFAGTTYSSNFPVTNSYEQSYRGGPDVFVGRLDTELSRTPQPLASVRPAGHNFGYVNLGAMATQTFEVVNIGRTNLVVGTLSLSDGDSLPHFSLANDLCSGRTLGVGATATVQVVFAPTSLWGKAVVLLIPSNDPDAPTNAVTIYGSGRDNSAAEDLFQAGLVALRNFNQEPHNSNDFLNADQKFQAALAANPNHYGACFYGALAGLMGLVHDADINRLLTDFGMAPTNRSIYGWTADFPETLPTNSPTSGHALEIVIEAVIPVLDEALDCLSRIPNTWGGSLLLSPAELPIDNDVQVDAGDMRMLQCGFEVLKTFLCIVGSYDLDVDVNHLDHVDTPTATITVDGNPADWAGIEPPFTDEEFDNQGGADADIYHVSTAMDATYAYVMVETYGRPIQADAPISLFLNYRPGQHFDMPGLDIDHDFEYDDMFVRFASNSISAWTTSTQVITGASSARGDVFEARIPLSELGNPAYFCLTYVNIWPFGLPPEPPGDPSNIEPTLYDYTRQFPAFGTITDPARLATASNSLVRAIDFYLAGSELIRGETDYQTDDLVIFDPDDLQEEQRTRFLLAQWRDALTGTTDPAFKLELSQLLDLPYVFTHPIAPRNLLAGSGVQGALADQVQHQVDFALSHLATAGAGFNQILTAGDYPVDADTEADYGDICILQAQLWGWKAFTSLADAYDVDVDIARLVSSGPVRMGDLMAAYPQLLSVSNAAALAVASNAVRAAVEHYLAGSSFIRDETDDQIDDVYTIEPDELTAEAMTRRLLEDCRSSLSVPVLIDTEDFYEYTHLAKLFTTNYVSRAHLPRFTDENKAIEGTFPDPTFNGVFPSNTQWHLSDGLGLDHEDSDADGLPDLWETEVLRTMVFGPTNDPDHDGMNNRQELVAGTDPDRANSSLSGAMDSAPASTNVVIQWSSVPYRYYGLDKTTNLLAPWQALERRIPATPPLNTYTDSAAGMGSGYYRILVGQ